MTLIAAAMGLAAQSQAALYDIAFTGDGSVADGQIDVVGGVATSGYLDVTAGPAQGIYSLYAWSGGGVSSVRVSGGTDLIVDNLVDVNAGANPFLTVNGMAFVTGDHSEGIDLSLASGTTYNLGGFGPIGYNVPNANGTATLSGVVPEPGTYGVLAGAGLFLVSLRNKFGRKQT